MREFEKGTPSSIEMPSLHCQKAYAHVSLLIPDILYCSTVWFCCLRTMQHRASCQVLSVRFVKGGFGAFIIFRLVLESIVFQSSYNGYRACGQSKIPNFGTHGLPSWVHIYCSMLICDYLWFQLYVLELQGTIWTKAIFLVRRGNMVMNLSTF